MNAKADEHLQSATAFLAVAEAGDAKWAAYTQVAIEIIAAKDADPTLTQTEIGQKIGKSQDWVSKLLIWHDDHRKPLPFSSTEAQRRYQERQVPTRHVDRVEMATKLLEDPTVVESVLARPSVAARGVANAVLEQEARERQKALERLRVASEQRAASAPPMSAAVSSMVTRINEWALALDGTHAIADELPPGRSTDVVAMALHNLDRATHDWLELIEGVSGSRLRVIEGQAG